MRHLTSSLSSLHELDEYRLFDMLLKKAPFCIHMKDDSGSIYHLLMAAAHDYKHLTNGSQTIIENSVISLLIYIIRLHERDISGDKVSTTRNEMIDELLKYIEINFGSSLSLEFLAAYVHLSPEYLSRYFRSNTGVKLSDYITNIRIEKAKYRLRTTAWNISDISEYCGYGSVSNFQKAFKKAVGMTAEEYRRTSVATEINLR